LLSFSGSYRHLKFYGKEAKHMNANENTILRMVPAAGELHKVPGFDPLQHLQRTVNENGDPVLQLGLRYKRLWFRLACPSGRLLLNPLRITDQMAIFEAQVFLRKEDPIPASSFTSTKTAQEDKAYIRAAQDEALSIALDNAGFGIQLCDITQGTNGGKPISKVSMQQTTPESEADEAVPPSDAAPPQAEAPVQVSEPAQQQTSPASVSEVQAETQPIMESEPHQEPEGRTTRESSSATVLNFPVQQNKPENGPAPVEGTAPTASAEPEAAVSPAYREDMSIEDISERMTVDEARKVVVAEGTCKGWTLEQVAERRPSSLKFFVTPFCEGTNIFKAAAALMLQEVSRQKAG